MAYLVPLSYRGEPLEGAPGEALIGTSEHGVLGTRWVYDGVHDPVVTAQLRALLRGEAVPQQQSESDTPDPTVTVYASGAGDELDVQTPPKGVVAGWTRSDGTAARGVFVDVSPSTASGAGAAGIR